MRAAIPTWNDRVSPVFDVARHLIVVDVEDNAEVSRSEAVIVAMPLADRAKQLDDQGVDVLICGAISQSLERMLASVGVTVIPNTCGLVEEVLRAFCSGQLTEQGFLMPGCGRRRALRGRQRRGGDRTNRETAIGCDKQETDASERKRKEVIATPNRDETGGQGKASGTGRDSQRRSGAEKPNNGADRGWRRGRGQRRGRKS